jgi:hypothetical protein
VLLFGHLQSNESTLRAKDLAEAGRPKRPVILEDCG